MAYSVIASVAAGSSDRNTVTTGAIDTTGANLLVLVRSDFGASRAAVSDSKGNTWNALTTSSNASTAACTIFWCQPSSVGSGHTFTATQANSFPTLNVIALAGGITGGNPDDQQNGATYTAATTAQPGSVTPGQNDEIIITGITADNAQAALAINSGFTIPTSVGVNTNHEGGALAYLIQTSAGATNPTWSWTAAATGALRIATFKPAVSVGLVSPTTGSGSMAGDYLVYRKTYSGWSANATITATAQAATAARTAKSANHQLYIQKISLSITTHANGKVALTVQSSNGTPVVVASHTDLTAAAGVPDTLVWDFGPEGIPIAVGENVNWLWSTGDSGPTGRAHIEGYEKLVGPVAPASTN